MRPLRNSEKVKVELLPQQWAIVLNALRALPLGQAIEPYLDIVRQVEKGVQQPEDKEQGESEDADKDGTHTKAS